MATPNGAGDPVECSAKKEIVWKYAIPGRGVSTPAVAGERIFITGTLIGP